MFLTFLPENSHVLHIFPFIRSQSYCQLSDIPAFLCLWGSGWMMCPWESAEPESLLLRIPFPSLLCILTLTVQVRHGNVTAENNVVIKFDLGFQPCCLLSIIKKKKPKNKGKETKILCEGGILPACFTNVLNYKVWCEFVKGEGSYFASRFSSVAFRMSDYPILPEKVFTSRPRNTI